MIKIAAQNVFKIVIINIYFYKSLIILILYFNLGVYIHVLLLRGVMISGLEFLPSSLRHGLKYGKSFSVKD